MAINNSPSNKIKGSRTEYEVTLRLLSAGIIVSGLIITGLVFYSFSVLDDNYKLSQRLAAATSYVEKAAERTMVTRYDQLIPTGTDNAYNIMIRISNEAAVPATYPYVLLYCAAGSVCPNSMAEPIVNPESISNTFPLTIEASGESQLQVGPVFDGVRYRIDVITYMGNIISSECTVNVAKQICENSLDVRENH